MMTINELLKNKKVSKQLRNYEFIILKKFMKRCDLDELMCDMDAINIPFDATIFKRNRIQCDIIGGNTSFLRLANKVRKIACE